MRIDTPRLQLHNCNFALLEAALAGDAALAAHTGWNVPPDWTEFGREAIAYVSGHIAHHPNDCEWWTWLPVVRDENLLIGTCGFKGIPNADGEVEIGYEVALSRRQQGYATEIAQALVAHAFSDDGVRMVLAHTLAEENPSTKILRKVGFLQTATLTDPDEGEIWRWELPRDQYEDTEV